MATRFFTTTATHLLQEITLVYVFTTLKPWGKWDPSSPFRDWVITCILFPRSRVFHLAVYDFGRRSIYLLLLGHFDFLIQISQIHCLICGRSLWIKSHACWHANNCAILDQFKETDNSLILLSLITLMMQLMVGVPRVTGTWDPKLVESAMTRATWSLS